MNTPKRLNKESESRKLTDAAHIDTPGTKLDAASPDVNLYPPPKPGTEKASCHPLLPSPPRQARSMVSVY